MSQTFFLDGESGLSTGIKTVMISVRSVSVCGKNFNVAIVSDTLNMINVKSRLMVVLIELHPFIPLSVTLIVFQGHSSVNCI